MTLAAGRSVGAFGLSIAAGWAGRVSRSGFAQRPIPGLWAGKEYSKNTSMKVAKVTSKGQITIPQEARQALGISDRSYLEVSVSGDEIRLRKIVRVRPLSDDDPIWQLVGAASGGAPDTSENHDRYLAEGEMDRWRESS